MRSTLTSSEAVNKELQGGAQQRRILLRRIVRVAADRYAPSGHSAAPLNLALCESMIQIRILCIVLIIGMLASCKYAAMSMSEIEEEIYNVTPMGLNSEEATKLIEERFGLKSFVGMGPASNTEKGWVEAGWSDQKTSKSPHFLTYRLGRYPSNYVVIPTTVYGTWFFDDGNKLVNVSVKKETDGI